LDRLNSIRIELVERLNQGLRAFDFLVCPEGRDECYSSYYVYPLRFLSEKAGVTRDDFVKGANAEGLIFYSGYVKPLYLQPVYQKRILLKKGYPFSAPENRQIIGKYNMGICRNSEKLHFEQMLINEHIRFPHDFEDIDDVIGIISKLEIA